MNYFKSIKTQILLAVSISLLVFLMVAMGGLYLFQEGELTRESIKKATEIGSVLKAGLKGQMVTHNTELLQTLVDEIKAYQKITGIYIINADGVVKFSSDPAFTGVKLSKESEECRKCHHQATEGDTTTLKTRNSNGLSILRNVTHIYNEPACFQCHPSSQKNLGLLFVDYSTADTDALISSTLMRLFFTAVMACIIISLVIFYIINRLIHKPTAMLIERTNEISSGNYQQPIRYEGSAEFKILNESFNDMSEKLRVSRDQLEERIRMRTGELNATNERLVQEIAEHKKAEEALQESETSHRTLIENSFDVIFTLDNKGNFLFVSQAWERHFDYTAIETIGKNFALFVHPDDVKPCMEYLMIVLETGQAGTSPEYRVKHADGSWRWFIANGSPYIDPKGQRQFMGTGRDITAHKQAEESIRDSEEKFSKAFEKAPLLMTISSIEDGTYIDVNEEFTEVTGFKREEAIGKTSVELGWIREQDRELLVHDLNKNGYIDGMELELEAKDKRKVFCLFYGEVINIGGRQRLLSIAQDITDRKTTEEEKRSLGERLQRAEKMESLGQLAGGVAHDLNNVLGILSGYSELLIDEVPDGSKSRGYAEKILKSTKKGAAIIDDLLTLARRGVTSSEVIHLNDVVSDFLVTPYFENIKNYHPRVSFRTECDETLQNIKGSPVHLEKTLMNLVSNAAEAVSGEGVVTIRTENRYLEKTIRGYDEINEGEYAVLIVSDTGAGIPAEDREKIFEPFYTKKKMGRSGTGLGLSIVWGTVKDYNGHIDLQSQEGEGTTFSLYFPVTGEELTALQEKIPIEQYMGRGESVLVVDDIPEQREIAANLLTKLGYEVHQAASGKDAVEYLKTNEADILVLDMIMPPGMDGLDTYKKILEIRPKQKAIIVSGFSANERVKEAQRLGVAAYIKKPYVLEKIGLAIRSELK